MAAYAGARGIDGDCGAEGQYSCQVFSIRTGETAGGIGWGGEAAVSSGLASGPTQVRYSSS